MRTDLLQKKTKFLIKSVSMRVNGCSVNMHPFGPAEVPAPPPPVEEPSQLNAYAVIARDEKVVIRARKTDRIRIYFFFIKVLLHIK